MSSNTKGNFENLAFDHGFSINISYNNCPSSFPVHWHNYAEMVFLIGKEITYTVNGKEHQLHQGDFLFIWPGELHAVLPNQQPDILICQFNSLLLDTIKMLLKSNYMLLRNLRLISHLECPKICETMASHLYIIKKICRKKGKHNSLSDMHMCIELFKLFTTLCSFLIEESDKKVFNGSVQANEATQKIIAACNYISNNCSRDISLEDAASYVGFSKYYFQGCSGNTPAFPLLIMLPSKGFIMRRFSWAIPSLILPMPPCRQALEAFPPSTGYLNKKRDVPLPNSGPFSRGNEQPVLCFIKHRLLILLIKLRIWGQ